MSRRHKTTEELERIPFHQRRSQGDESLHSLPDANAPASNPIRSIDLVVNYEDGQSVTLPLGTPDGGNEKDAEKTSISGFLEENICKDISSSPIYHGGVGSKSFPKFLELLISKIIQEYLEKQFKPVSQSPLVAPPPGYTPSSTEQACRKVFGFHDDEADAQPKSSGRKLVERLVDGVENYVICSWYDTICHKLKLFLNEVKQLCTFFCALFDFMKIMPPYGRVACYHRMMKDHIKEKIPCVKSLQNGVKWFWDWKKRIRAWKDKRWEVDKFNAWDWLYNLIMGELPQLQPSLAKC